MRVIVATPEELTELIRAVLYQQSSQPNHVAPTNTSPKELLSLAECAALTGFAKPTIYKLVSQKQIPFSKRNGRLFFFRSRIEEWIKEGTKEPKSALAAAESRLLPTRKRKGGVQ